MIVSDLHNNPKYRILQFNVGQGDHLLIQFPDGEYGIVDFYFEHNDSELTEPPAITFFRNVRGKVKIKFICISHLDKDHLTGFEESLHVLLNDIEAEVDEVWIPSYADFRDFFSEELGKNLELKRELGKLIGTKKINHLQSDNFQRIAFLNNNKSYRKLIRYISKSNDYKELGFLRTKFLAPDNRQIVSSQKQAYKTSTDMILYVLSLINDSENASNLKFFKDGTNRNDMSIVFTLESFTSENHNAIFTGDTSKGTLEKNIDSIQAMRFIKGAHHGSKFSSSSKLWQNLLPQKGRAHVSFSAGRKKGHIDHPDFETINDIQQSSKRKNLDQLFITWTNVCEHTIKNCEKHKIEKEALDIFEFEEQQNQIDSFLDFDEQEFNDVPKGGVGLLGILHEFDEDGVSKLKFLTCKGMKIYNDCNFNNCPLSV